MLLSLASSVTSPLSCCAARVVSQLSLQSFIIYKAAAHVAWERPLLSQRPISCVYIQAEQKGQCAWLMCEHARSFKVFMFNVRGGCVVSCSALIYTNVKCQLYTYLSASLPSPGSCFSYPSQPFNHLFTYLVRQLDLDLHDHTRSWDHTGIHVSRLQILHLYLFLSNSIQWGTSGSYRRCLGRTTMDVTTARSDCSFKNNKCSDWEHKHEFCFSIRHNRNEEYFFIERRAKTVLKAFLMRRWFNLSPAFVTSFTLLLLYTVCPSDWLKLNCDWQWQTDRRFVQTHAKYFF